MNAVLSPLLLLLVEEGPEPEDVVAGWMGFAVFIGLIIAVALLGWSLTRHLRKAESNAADGAFGPAATSRSRRQAGDSGGIDTADSVADGGGDGGGGGD